MQGTSQLITKKKPTIQSYDIPKSTHLSSRRKVIIRKADFSTVQF